VARTHVDLELAVQAHEVLGGAPDAVEARSRADEIGIG